MFQKKPNVPHLDAIKDINAKSSTTKAHDHFKSISSQSTNITKLWKLKNRFDFGDFFVAKSNFL